MHVRFWGTRGSVPTPGPKTVKYGGNTSCVEIRADDGTLIILDCGTGARELGLSLMAQRPVRAHLLIGHSHWDHIQGFPFFTPAFAPDTEMTVYAPAGFQQDLEQALAGQMQYSYFPVRLKDLSSRIHFMSVEEGVFYIGKVAIETQYLNHTTPTIGYRITSGGATVVYSTDHEPFGAAPGGLAHPGDQRHVAFLNQAHLVIHDAQYSEDEYPSKLGWGHSPVNYVTTVAAEAGVQRLALFHHDPTHDDAIVQRLGATSQSLAAALRSTLQVFAAGEGTEIYLPERRGVAAPVTRHSALDRKSIAGARVLVATADADLATLIVGILIPDGVEPIVVTDSTTAIAEAKRLQPDMAVLDADLFDNDLRSIATSFTAGRNRAMALILLTASLDDEAIRRGHAAGITDYLAKPFSPPMLHARVRAWLTRSYRTSSASEPGTPEQREAAQEPTPIKESPGQSAAVVAELPRATNQGSRKTTVLASTSIFGVLNSEELSKLADRARFRSYPPGTAITRQGEKAQTLFIIASGRVRVVGRAPDARAAEILLGELGAGEVFSELSLLDGLPHSATVVAVSRTRCLAIGRDDFLAKLVNPDFGYRLALVLARRLREADRLLLRDGPDALTGLATRRTLELEYKREAAAARRRGYDLAFLFVDVDDLKGINDNYGHLMGDDALQAMADALRGSTRESDIVARIGGDEFVVLLSDTGPDGARLVKARIHRRLQALVTQRALPAVVTCSIGLAVSQNPPPLLDDFLQEADQAMYQEKRKDPDGGPRGKPGDGNVSGRAAPGGS